MIRAGRPELLGATPQTDGINFAIWSPDAEAVELCLFDSDARESARFEMPACADGVWHGFLPECAPGQAYGYRAHGKYSPADGLRFNPAKLLLDPYAREMRGEFRWDPAVFDFDPTDGLDLHLNTADSAAYIPKCVVAEAVPNQTIHRPGIPWRDAIIYEANVRGYTMHHPGLSERERGRFRGMRNAQILDYLVALGITSIELMPVHEFIDEQHLHQSGARNLWGYNSINFFTPARRYLGEDGVPAFREMVDAIHAAGIEVILDVAFNHTGEGGSPGPTLCYRGLDNLGYYRTVPGNPGAYINDTGCGNTLNMDTPVARQLVIDSLDYWSGVMGVDGFRFDLAPVLGRSAAGFNADHPMLKEIANAPSLAGLKLIAEPWDPGPGGYQLGEFPAPFAEWNDRFRDDVRRFWRGDFEQAGELAKRLHGSADLFDSAGRGLDHSINFITCHDGFTLADLVSYQVKHNEANGEDNRDGHQHNFSSNFGVEGPTDNPAVLRQRRQRSLNLMASLLLAQGTPMILGGDEMGNSQHGNNNAYAQDNATGWIDWSNLNNDTELLESTRALVQLRKSLPLLRPTAYAHGQESNQLGWPDVAWYRPDGDKLEGDHWRAALAFCMINTTTDPDTSNADLAVAILVNGEAGSVPFRLPDAAPKFAWRLAFVSSPDAFDPTTDGRWELPAQSVACLRCVLV